MKLSINNRVLSAPIPTERSIDGWEQMPIIECGERLVSLNNIDARIKCESEFVARESVATKLMLASTYLPSDCVLYIRDAHRTIAMQKELFDEYYNKLASEHPNATESELIKLTNDYVIIPTANPLAPPPHSTGGAIDLTIHCNGEKIEMGSVSGKYVPQDETAYYEMQLARNNITLFGVQSLINRRILYNAMIFAGFTNNPNEWWHFDYGNQFWAKIKGTTAVYGMID